MTLKKMAACVLAACLAATASAAEPEVRGTWLTTTANSALRTPADTADAMRRIHNIGMNTVYVESWKNGYTQYPSEVLRKAIGVAQRPDSMRMDASDARGVPARDLLEEALIEAHRNGLLYVAWFEYGFMASYKETVNDLRRQKPEWLSRDKNGSEIAPNGFVWLNPLHPEAQQLLIGLVLEAVDRYDLDGVQLDDHVVWPGLEMGYDEYTQQAYAKEHNGQRPPQDEHDAEWMRWRAEKIDDFSRRFVQALRAHRPGLLISLSPAPHPWVQEHYLLNWPAWSARTAPGERWDEFIPQAYRVHYADYERTWLEQVEAMRTSGGNRQRDMLAGIRIVGDGPDSSWEQLRKSIELARSTGSGGHVLWYSRGVLDLYEKQLTEFYAQSGPSPSPRFPAGWRQASLVLQPAAKKVDQSAQGALRWIVPALHGARYRAIGHDGVRWHYLDAPVKAGLLALPARYQRVELLLDRRAASKKIGQLQK